MSEQVFKNVYITEQNDTWDLIAFKIFGDEKYTSQLLLNNPELSKIVFFPAGISLIIPQIEKNNTGVELPWIR